MVWGTGLRDGLRLKLGPPASITLPTERVDDRHLTALLPPIALPEATGEAAIEATLVAEDGRPIAGAASITVVNEAGFPTPAGLAVSADGALAFALSTSTDELWVWRRKPAAGAASKPSAPERIPVGDGPRALAVGLVGGVESVVVAHEHAAELRVVPVANLRGEQRRIPVRGGGSGLVLDGARGKAYVANHRCNCVQVVDLGRGVVEAEAPAGARPKPLALSQDGRLLVAGNAGSGDLSLLDLGAGAIVSPERRVQARRGTPILGGHNQAFSAFVMGSKAPRAVVHSAACGRLFVASAGLNIGPNPQRMEITTNGGVAVVDPKTGRFERHVSILAGIPAALALDDARGLLYAADLSRGLLVVLDAKRLCGDDASARAAVLASLPLPIPEGTRLIRPLADFGGPLRRAGVEVHSGPTALALTDSGQTVLVLSKFHGGLVEIDVGTPASPKILAQRPGPPMAAQAQRRLGEVIYFTDLGRSTMTCDACHPDGHDDGLIFEKTHPQRLYRSVSLRSVRETPPYFFPAGFPTLEMTADVVLGRNRLGNPAPTLEEIAALTAYQKGIVALPNPNLGERGELPTQSILPDSKRGNPRRGLQLFEGKAGCSASACHPGPQFTADQSAETRGAAHDVGTEVALPLRPRLQEAPPGPHQVPSLVGAWDEFPLFASGAAGFAVAADGTVEAAHRFPLRRVVEHPGREQHGGLSKLDEQERDDLLAYLLTL